MPSFDTYFDNADRVYSRTDYNGYYDVLKSNGMLATIHTMCNYTVISRYLKTDEKVLVLDRYGNIIEKNFELN